MKKTIRKWMLSIKNELQNPARTPHLKALSVGIGVFIAISPFMGFHFIMAFAILAMYRKLDRVLVLAFTMLNNWWTMVPIYGLGLWIGGALTGHTGFRADTVQWDMFRLSKFIQGDGIRYGVTVLKPMILPFMVGNMVLAVIASVGAYYFVRSLLKRRSLKVENCEGICVPSSEHN